MDENLVAALEAWDVEKEPTPLVNPAYQLPEQGEAERLEKVTEQKFAQAQELDESGDRYELVGVIGAVSLFFLGIAGVFRSPRMKITATTIGGVVLVVSGALLAAA